MNHPDTAIGDLADGPDGIDAVVFDYGNVIYTWEAVGAIAGRVPLARWQEFVTQADFTHWNTMFDAGVPLTQVLAALAAAHPDRPDWVEILRTYWEHFADTKTGPVPGTAAIIEDLLEADVPLYALTNFNDVLFDATRHLSPLLERFRGIVVSGREHLVKPDPAVYRLLLDRYRLHAGRTLFIDDSPVNVEAARAVGMQAHRFTGAGMLRAVLIEAGLLPAPLN
ncbi:HAD family phosphatase [Actinomyces sp. MRS3W]|uniref:HAD family hydrolase n=1 Tax=Actinomyces sp. MRS3W TaxID=2800796 RepID=UPI0028FDAD72|nr:HAD family phosphatase [Actinomyces sp. MRS3W]MDU0348647.1 HAD family phosphatase [Actinomyces sp. MRS3W]